mgnify:CR=1 FL=1
MNKIKQILAIVGIVILVLLYVSTLIFAILDNPATMKMLGLSIVMTIFIPTLIWIFEVFFRISNKDNSELFNDDASEENDDDNDNEASENHSDDDLNDDANKDTNKDTNKDLKI